MHTKLNLCALIRKATSPHKTEPLWNWLTNWHDDDEWVWECSLSMYICVFKLVSVYWCVCVCVCVVVRVRTHAQFLRFVTSLSSCRAASMDLLCPLSPPVSIVHCSREVFKSIACIGTELLHIGSCWSSCLCSFMWRGPQEYVTYEFVPTSPAIPRMSGWSNLDSFRGESRWWYTASWVGELVH